MRALVFTALVIGALTSSASADDDFAGATIIFARGRALVRVDPLGKHETEIATLGPGTSTVRKLETDAAGKVLLADVDGSWQWMPLDGSAKSLTTIACGDGPAQLAEDGTCVLCRTPGKPGSQIVNLARGKTLAIDQPGARVTGMGAERRIVWADKDGVWSVAPGLASNRKAAKRVAPEAPLRGFLPSPDGSRALGVFSDEIYVDVHHQKTADVLEGFELDGQGARRKAIKAGVPLEWSHDSAWVLVQNGSEACLMHATGGEYKCWKGYTAASISSDGKFGLFLGNRDGSHRQTPATRPDKNKSRKAKKSRPPEKRVEPADEPETETGSGDPNEDVAVPPPSGPLSLFRARLEGSPFTESPALIVKIVDGAAVWVPAP
ncbi:MAG: hypothetical protein ABI467_06590 [Kofleriaceae bacterium]